MGFEDDPKDEVESYPCNECIVGNIIFNKDIGYWECDSCDWCASNTVPCKWCGDLTDATGIKECASCWELRHRIELNPKLAERMLKELK